VYAEAAADNATCAVLCRLRAAELLEADVSACQTDNEAEHCCKDQGKCQPDARLKDEELDLDGLKVEGNEKHEDHQSGNHRADFQVARPGVRSRALSQGEILLSGSRSIFASQAFRLQNDSLDGLRVVSTHPNLENHLPSSAQAHRQVLSGPLFATYSKRRLRARPIEISACR
jgi:hypothetical protein